MQVPFWIDKGDVVVDITEKAITVEVRNQLHLHRTFWKVQEGKKGVVVPDECIWSLDEDKDDNGDDIKVRVRHVRMYRNIYFGGCCIISDGLLVTVRVLLASDPLLVLLRCAVHVRRLPHWSVLDSRLSYPYAHDNTRLASTVVAVALPSRCVRLLSPPHTTYGGVAI